MNPFSKRFRFMFFISINAFCFLFALLLYFTLCLRANAFGSVHDQIIVQVNDTEVQCFRMLNGTDTVGCQTSQNGNIGVLTEIVHDTDVQKAIDNLPSGMPNIIAVVNVKDIDETLIEMIHSHTNVAGLLLVRHGNEKPEEFSEDAACPNRRFTFYSKEMDIAKCHGWNQKNAVYPDGLKFVNFNKPLRLVTNRDEIELIFKKCIEPFNKKKVADGLRCVGRMTQFMSAAGNAKICLGRAREERFLCEAFEDVNVFLMLPPLTQLNEIADQFVLAARMDSFSTFRDAKGGDLSTLSSLVSLLLVAHSVGQKMETFNRLANLTRRQLLFAFLHGESLGYIGSSRWMWDMGRAKFPAPAKNFPAKSDNVRQIGVDALSFFMELQQIGASSALYAHTDANVYQHNKTLIDKVLYDANRTGAQFGFIDPSSTHFGAVPPSSYHSILKTSAKVPGVILSSFGSDEYTYRYSNSFLDDEIRTNPKQLNEFLDRIIMASNIALGAALSYVLDNATAVDEFKIDKQYTQELGNCFFNTTNWSCPLFRTLTNATSNRKIDAYLRQTANSFSIGVPSGRLRSPIISDLMRFLLTHSTGNKKSAENVRTPKQCLDLNGAQNVYNFEWMNDQEGNASCHRTTIYETVARSPAFEIQDYDFASGRYSTWVASIWTEEAKFELYLKADLHLELYAFGTALIVLIFCIPLLYAPKEQWFLDNFLPPGSPQPL